MPASRSPAFSFRTILFLIAIAGVLPAIVFSGVLLKRFAENERLRTERALVDSTKAIARGIDAQFNTAEAAILALASSALLQAGNIAQFEKRVRRYSLRARTCCKAQKFPLLFFLCFPYYSLNRRLRF